MKAIERATSHYKAKKLKQIEVPEWADDSEKPLIIYVEPFTLRDQGRLHQATKSASESEALAELLILKAMDANGEKMFTLEDKHALRTQVDANVVARIAAQIMMVDVEDVEKN
jgi:hypothetical protein